MNAPMQSIETLVDLISYWGSELCIKEAELVIDALHKDGGGTPSLADFRLEMLDDLERCAPYFISDELLSLATASAGSLPNIPLRRDMVPPGYGYFHFSHPLIFHGEEAPLLPWVGFLWCNVDGTGRYDRYIGEDSFEENIPMVCFTKFPGRTPLTISDKGIWDIGTGWNDSWGHAVNDRPDIGSFERRIILTIFALMKQSLVTQTNHSLTRSTQRRLSKALDNYPSMVKVIHLRKHEATTRREDWAGQPVDWSHRWIVQAHWRNQYYPSTNTHSPVLIAPYVKGPDTKPLWANQIVLTSLDR